MLTRILIANRGEIAVRIIRTCRELGIETVAVYSDADTTALHVSLADLAIRLGPAPPAESYLSLDRILAAADETGADAIHPGYGFLSEDPRFADACARAGVTFIGPSAAALARMGSKIAARDVAARAGVPIVPGVVPADQSDEAVIAAATGLGFPLLIKPSAGGGGIGMKPVREPSALPSAIVQARREALAAFGDGTLYVERLIQQPRHVEIQILVDRHGQAIHLFERDCSVQRRNQKIVEETPSAALTPALRHRMGAAAVALARAGGYENAGTVEFLLDGRGDGATFYFLEMNARLQVEHPITEQVTGVDLVRAQIAVASGDRLPWSQESLTQRGHAIEARVYAEDPTHDDVPQAGPLLLYRQPSIPGVRIDAGYIETDSVSVHYDPLLAKVIATGDTREAARQRAIQALRSFPILGVRTNIPFLLRLLSHPRFIAGDIDTGFLSEEGAALRADIRTIPSADAAAVAAAVTQRPLHGDSELIDPWSAMRGYRV